jgi:hypothetical protein
VRSGRLIAVTSATDTVATSADTIFSASGIRTTSEILIIRVTFTAPVILCVPEVFDVLDAFAARTGADFAG